MFVRGITLSLTALLAIVMLGTAAQAEERKLPPPEDHYSGPGFLRHVPGIRLLFGGDTPSDADYDSRSGKAGNFDESYYEPEPVPQAKQKKKTTAAPQKPATASGEATPKTSGAPAKAKPVTQQANASAPQKPSASGLSCDKAGSVISGYGFSNVTPSSCAGKVYAFNAQRDGKSFAIKLDPASGELTEVKKLP